MYVRIVNEAERPPHERGIMNTNTNPPALTADNRTVHVDGDAVSYTLRFTSAEMWLIHDIMLNTEILLQMSIEDEETSAWIREKGTQRIAESKRLRLALMGIYED